MHQRVRCPHCHHWTDALLVWAAGDCCPACNAPIAGSTREVEETEDERPLDRPSRLLQPRFSQPRPERPRPERFSQRP
jgi:hypothetical protein